MKTRKNMKSVTYEVQNGKYKIIIIDNARVLIMKKTGIIHHGHGVLYYTVVYSVTPDGYLSYYREIGTTFKIERMLKNLKRNLH